MHYFCGDNSETNPKLYQYEEVSITLCSGHILGQL